MNITAGEKTITATLADNDTAKELAEKLKAGVIPYDKIESFFKQNM